MIYSYEIWEGSQHLRRSFLFADPDLRDMDLEACLLSMYENHLGHCKGCQDLSKFYADLESLEYWEDQADISFEDYRDRFEVRPYAQDLPEGYRLVPVA